LIELLQPVTVFERLTLTAPLGVVFHDAATGERVGAGLVVSVYEPGRPSRRERAHPNNSGVYVLHRAPGLDRAVAFGAGDEAFWANPPQRRAYVLEVVDAERRFQPFTLEIDLPHEKIFRWVSPLDSSPPPPDALSSVPLYSAPSRTLPPGYAVVRAQLFDAATNGPAAWAAVEAYFEDGLVARGFSDAEGRLALVFPHPSPLSFPVAPGAFESPPVARGLPLLEQSWELTFVAGYAARPADEVAPAIPDLRATLEQLMNARAQLWADEAGGAELSSVTLRYGRELVLRTRVPSDSSTPAPGSALLITPAGSPP